ncbi:CD27 antigen [Sorex fumeus]|uniref:CD27 antigen n=1 Tax=Sorex fumeus TaxID=62283 RepID=UPI0024ADC1CD|nr:CD27 antigen [Sorex fumeus]
MGRRLLCCLWLLGVLAGLPATPVPGRCPEKHYWAGDSLCCPMCEPGTFLVKDCVGPGRTPKCSPCVPGRSFNPRHHHRPHCESCRLCHSGLLLRNCTLTANTECACPHGLQCRDETCSECDPPPPPLLPTRPSQTPAQNLQTHRWPEAKNTPEARMPLEMVQSPANARQQESGGPWLDVIRAAPEIRAPRSLCSSDCIRIFVVFSGMFLACTLVGALFCHQRRQSGRSKEGHPEGPAEPGPHCCPREEEGSAFLPIQEDYRKPEPASET